MTITLIFFAGWLAGSAFGAALVWVGLPPMVIATSWPPATARQLRRAQRAARLNLRGVR